MILTLLTMLSWSKPAVAHDTDRADHRVHTEHARNKTHHHKHKTTRSEQDVNQKDLSKYTDDCLKLLVNLLELCIKRNELKDPEDLENRLKYQQTRGGITPCGVPYKTLSMSHYLNLLEDEIMEMRKDLEAMKKELTKRGHKCGCDKG